MKIHDEPQGPSINKEVKIDMPNFIKITSQEEEKEFNDFIAQIINAAREAWLKEIVSE